MVGNQGKQLRYTTLAVPVHADPCSCWVIPANEGKGERMTRIVYLSDNAFRLTRSLEDRYPEGNLFRNCRGVPWTAESVNCAVDRLRLRIGKTRMEKRGLDLWLTSIHRSVLRARLNSCGSEAVVEPPISIICAAFIKRVVCPGLAELRQRSQQGIAFTLRPNGPKILLGLQRCGELDLK